MAPQWSPRDGTPGARAYWDEIRRDYKRPVFPPQTVRVSVMISDDEDADIERFKLARKAIQ